MSDIQTDLIGRRVRCLHREPRNHSDYGTIRSVINDGGMVSGVGFHVEWDDGVLSTIHYIDGRSYALVPEESKEKLLTEDG